MSQEPLWTPSQAIVDLHALQITEHGGAAEIRDRAALESALARPRQIYSYSNTKPDIPKLAASYAWGISKNHPFVDGNKRMALIAMGVFLGLNDYFLDAREHDAFEMMMALADGVISEPDLAQWVRSNALMLKTF